MSTPRALRPTLRTLRAERALALARCVRSTRTARVSAQRSTHAQVHSARTRKRTALTETGVKQRGDGGVYEGLLHAHVAQHDLEVVAVAPSRHQLHVGVHGVAEAYLRADGGRRWHERAASGG